MNVYRQDPNAIVLYTVDWTDALAGDTIATATWIATNTPTQTSPSNTTVLHRVRLSGLAVGTSYRMTSRVLTAAGLQYDYSFIVVGKES
jgi:hypothetical protein